MELIHYITFVLVSMGLIIVPGPNVLVIVSTSIAQGTQRGLLTVLGTSSAMVIQLMISALGTAWLVESLAKGFVWLRWVGVVYLLYLGAAHLVSLAQRGKSNKAITAAGSYSRGFIVSLTNPKTILFFSAFLPQFVSTAGDYMRQIVLLSLTFLLLATVLDSMYAIFAGYARRFLRARIATKMQNSISGILYLGAGAWLAAMKKA